jgi:hypothetical protein
LYSFCRLLGALYLGPCLFFCCWNRNGGLELLSELSQLSLTNLHQLLRVVVVSVGVRFASYLGSDSLWSGRNRNRKALVHQGRPRVELRVIGWLETKQRSFSNSISMQITASRTTPPASPGRSSSASRSTYTSTPN